LPAGRDGAVQTGGLPLAALLREERNHED